LRLPLHDHGVAGAEAGENLGAAAVAEASLLLARQQVSQAEAQLSIAERQLSDATLLAPCDGVVSARLKEPGEMVGPGTPVVKVNAPSCTAQESRGFSSAPISQRLSNCDVTTPWMVHLGVEEQAVANSMAVARMRVGKRLNCFIRLIRMSLSANILFPFFNSNVESHCKHVKTHHKDEQMQ